MFFGEYLSTEKWLFILLLSLAGLFIHLDEKMKLKSFLSKETLTVFVWIITSVWFNSTIKIASINNGFWEVSFWSNLITLILLLPSWPLFSKDLSVTSIKNYAGVAINTALWTAGILFPIKALAVNVSISTAIMSVPLSMFFAMILSFISPKLLEKHPPKIYIIRITAATIMFICALALSN